MSILVVVRPQRTRRSLTPTPDVHEDAPAPFASSPPMVMPSVRTHVPNNALLELHVVRTPVLPTADLIYLHPASPPTLVRSIAIRHHSLANIPPPSPSSSSPPPSQTRHGHSLSPPVTCCPAATSFFGNTIWETLSVRGVSVANPELTSTVSAPPAPIPHQQKPCYDHSTFPPHLKSFSSLLPRKNAKVPPIQIKPLPPAFPQRHITSPLSIFSIPFSNGKPSEALAKRILSSSRLCNP
ncbi:hypothetical protein F5878DRAFT_678366 [Lentinula raphanica]|uniref:Uncharacterized protein n=1 Tax=Lentinula raphanica TaxID=153919 RepID=A0AA38UFA6_9AGAR|nr:hypothetical protein F5878DRAFT_678366 [Lentinula raphanica]